jgi:hypothetical protein
VDLKAKDAGLKMSETMRLLVVCLAVLKMKTTKTVSGVRRLDAACRWQVAALGRAERRVES